MLPPISANTSIEMIRDGGSLQAGFVGANGSKYCLHFALVSEEAASGELVRLGYEQPVVFERLEVREEKRIEWQAINQVEVSWEHAKVLLHQLRAFLQRDQDSKWLAAMEEVANTKGEIPGEVPRVPGPTLQLRRDA
ncbi:hypothetical protein [Ideonella sp. YS5]|uniref:hypothetical protein n=1 Tax=Ideonella sp. YS5 TaxID=3453714 RepID=UPI003EEAD98C